MENEYNTIESKKRTPSRAECETIIKKILKKETESRTVKATFKKTAEYMNSFLAHELGCFKEDILSYELNLYPYEGGCQLGLAGELVSAGRLDNITSVMACLKGMMLCVLQSF